MSKQPTKEEIADYLIALRDSGEVNMWGAAPYLEAAFNLSRAEAKAALIEWIKSFKQEA